MRRLLFLFDLVLAGASLVVYGPPWPGEGHSLRTGLFALALLLAILSLVALVVLQW